MMMELNPAVRREAYFFDDEMTELELADLAARHCLPLYVERTPPTFETKPKRGLDVESLRTLVLAAEFRRDDTIRQLMDAEREVMRRQDALTAALDRQAKESGS